MSYRSCGEAVVAEYGEFFGKNISLRTVCLLAVPCLAFEESVQVLLAAVEIVEEMLAFQLLYWPYSLTLKR